MKVTVTESERKDKRLKATFTSSDGKETSTHFGYKGGSTYIDHGDEKKRAAYLARHRVNENWDDPKTAGALSRWLLWGDHKTLQANVRAFKRKFTST
jgi:hypothetical protein